MKAGMWFFNESGTERRIRPYNTQTISYSLYVDYINCVMPVLYFIFQGWAFIISYRRKSLTKVRPIFQVKISKIFMIPNCLLHNSYQNWTWLNLTELDWTWLNLRIELSSKFFSNRFKWLQCNFMCNFKCNYITISCYRNCKLVFTRVFFFAIKL